jgi:hypothetical protein
MTYNPMIKMPSLIKKQLKLILHSWWKLINCAKVETIKNVLGFINIFHLYYSGHHSYFFAQDASNVFFFSVFILFAVLKYGYLLFYLCWCWNLQFSSSDSGWNTMSMMMIQRPYISEVRLYKRKDRHLCYTNTLLIALT